MIKVSTLKKNPKNPQTFINSGFSGIIEDMKTLGKPFLCGACGITFYTRKSDKNRQPKYCSSRCYGQTLKLHIQCKICGVEIQNPHGVSIRKRLYCSRQCKGVEQRGRQLSDDHKQALSSGRKASAKCKGPNLYNWKGGKATEAERMRESRHNRRALVHIKIDRKFCEALRQAQKDRCFYCEDELKAFAAIEHLTPISKGGDNQKFNLVWACKSCNSTKRSKTLESFAINTGNISWSDKWDEVFTDALQIYGG